MAQRTRDTSHRVLLAPSGWLCLVMSWLLPCLYLPFRGWWQVWPVISILSRLCESPQRAHCALSLYLGVRHLGGPILGEHQWLWVQEDVGTCWGETWHRPSGNRACEFMSMAASYQPAVHIWPTLREETHLAKQL